MTANQVNRLGSLQVLRALAATSVAEFHLGEAAKADPSYDGIFTYFRKGEVSVELFFFLSGFIIFYTASALLHKWSDSRGSPFPGQTYPATFVTGMPSAVKPFRTATRTWNSAT